MQCHLKEHVLNLSQLFASRLFGVRRLGIACLFMLFGALPIFVASAAPAKGAGSALPTIVFVHGAFAESSSWNGVATRLTKQGFHVIAAANPLRSVQSDAAYVASVMHAVEGPMVLVGHSYGGSVINAAALGNAQVKALVFVAAFAPDKGETGAELSGRFPGGSLGNALAAPRTLPGGGKELSIRQESFRDQFAADVSIADATLMAVTQRPIAEAALGEPSGEPAWKTIPSWFIYGSSDKNIPAEAHKFMADRAGSRKTVVIQGASHVVMVSHPKEVAALIAQAAAANTDKTRVPQAFITRTLCISLNSPGGAILKTG